MIIEERYRNGETILTPGSRAFTPYVDVNEILGVLLREVCEVLDEEFVGMYLHGSLAMGDFNSDTSDIDYLVVTDKNISDRRLASLKTMHSRITAIDSRWTSYLEGSFIPKIPLRRYDPSDCHHPRHGVGEALRIEAHDSDWALQRFILYHYGLVMAGPPPQELIDPVLPDELRQAVLDLLWWWELQVKDTTNLGESAYRAYAILTMCRVFYTLEFGTVVTKPSAARWALESLDGRWSSQIEQALRWRPGMALSGLDEVVTFIQFTLDQAGHTWKSDIRDGGSTG